MDAEFHLIRYESNKGRTFGLMWFDGIVPFICDTLENSSRLIPAGTYELETRMSPFGCWSVCLKNVPNRRNIRIEQGDRFSVPYGSILLGKRNDLILFNGLNAFARFCDVYFMHDKVKLIIR